MKLCHECGEGNPDNAIFCKICNAPLNEPSRRRLCLTHKGSNYTMIFENEDTALGRAQDFEQEFICGLGDAISRKHCHIIWKDGKWAVYDGSTGDDGKWTPSKYGTFIKLPHSSTITPVGHLPVVLPEGASLYLTREEEFVVRFDSNGTEKPKPLITCFVIYCPNCGAGYLVDNELSNVAECDICESSYDKRKIGRIRTAARVTMTADDDLGAFIDKRTKAEVQYAN